MSPAWTADVERLKILFLSFPLGGTFGPSMRQGVVKPNVLFSGSEKFPVDTEVFLSFWCWAQRKGQSTMEMLTLKPL